MSGPHRLRGRGLGQLAPDRRLRLWRYLVLVGRDRAAKALGIGIHILERAVDPHELLREETLRRLDEVLDRLPA